MATSDLPAISRMPLDEMVSAVEAADAVLVEAMKKATVIISLHDLNQVTAAAACAIERVQELEAQMAEACERLERILAGCEPCEATAEALVREFAEESVEEKAPAGVAEFMDVHGLEPVQTAFDGANGLDTGNPSPALPKLGEGDAPEPEPQPELSPQAVEERAWLADRGLDTATVLLFVRWMSGMPRGTSVSEAAARWDLEDDQALAMMRRYGPVIGKLRELRGQGFDAKLAEFKDRLGVAA